MSIKITLDDLKNISKHITDEKFQEQLNDFLTDSKDDYYFYGYEPLDAKYLKINIIQLGNLLQTISGQNYTSLFEVINEVYQAGFLTNQQSVDELRNYKQNLTFHSISFLILWNCDKFFFPSYLEIHNPTNNVTNHIIST
jgi:hypothetical protein